MMLLKSVAFFFVIGTCLSNPTTQESQPKDTTSSAPAPQNRVNETKSNITSMTATNDAENEIPDEGWEFENTTVVDSRRILYSKTVGKGKRPYMVYLSLTKESAKAHKYRGWLCGGVIVDPSYVLTSAACVEDADRFYIVSGTTKFVDSFDYKTDDCVCKHRRRVVWKCIPKNYKFDFQDSIKWSSNDIAIVKVDKPFKLGVLEKGCQFPVDLICYNNISRELEKPGTKGYIAGWGSGSNFREGVYRRQNGEGGGGGTTNVHRPENAKCLQEAKVCVMDNEQCAKKWAQRFRTIITQYMICTKDVMRRLSEICDKKYANCTDVENRRRQLDEDVPDASSSSFNVDLGRHLRDPDDYTARRSSMQGGFCENDHGGPLIVKYQGKERVIGVISACKIDPKSHSCHGPFLYTSVFRNRQFISCAIHKDVEDNCRRVFRTGITHEEYTVDWKDYEEDDDEKGEDKADKPDSSDSSSGEGQKAVLRQNMFSEIVPIIDSLFTSFYPVTNRDKKDTETKSEKKEVSSSSSSSESAENQKETKKEKEPTPEPAKKEKKKKDKTKKDKKKSKEGKKPKEESNDDDAHVKTGNKEVFYESSKDENVNDPEE